QPRATHLGQELERTFTCDMLNSRVCTREMSRPQFDVVQKISDFSSRLSGYRTPTRRGSVILQACGDDEYNQFNTTQFQRTKPLTHFAAPRSSSITRSTHRRTWPDYSFVQTRCRCD